MSIFSGDSDEGFGEAEFDDWNDRMDSELRKHRVNPTAFSRDERFAAWSEGIDLADCAEAFARSYYADLAGYDDCVAPGDRDDAVDHSYAANYETCEVCGGRKPYQRSCDCHDNHCQ